jgi:hypothetical protein
MPQMQPQRSACLVVVVLLVATLLVLQPTGLSTPVSAGEVCSEANICVKAPPNQSTRFSIDIGDGSGFKVGRTLLLRIGTTYTFVGVPGGQGFGFHPFSLTLSANGAATPISDAISPSNNSFTFTPSEATPGTIYYQCEVHSGLGAPIQIVPADFTPSPTATPTQTATPTGTATPRACLGTPETTGVKRNKKGTRITGTGGDDVIGGEAGNKTAASRPSRRSRWRSSA